VSHDILNLYGDFTPKFVKKYGNIDENIITAIKKYSKEVRSKLFPTEKHIFTIKK
jgi:3-methyl-2-oxobutanoate hydroxymethyltransferase